MPYNNGYFGNWIRIFTFGPFNQSPSQGGTAPFLDFWTNDALEVFFDDWGFPFEVEPIAPPAYWKDDSLAIFTDDWGAPFEVELPPIYSYWVDDSGSVFTDDTLSPFIT